MDVNTVLLIASLLLNAFLLNIIVQQAKDMGALRRKQADLTPIVEDAAMHATIREKIETIGVIPTVKFLRETYNLSLLEAKQLVDRVNERE